VSLVGRLLGGETRASLESTQYPLTGGMLTEWMSGPFASSGVQVNEKNALRFPAMWRAVSLISGTCAALPLQPYRSGSRTPTVSQILSKPHRDLPPVEFWRLSYIHRLLWGNFAAFKVRDAVGRVTELLPLNPASMRYGRSSSGDKVYSYDDAAGHQFAWTDTEVFHLPGMGFDGVAGVSPVKLAMQAIGLGIAAEEYGARLFGSGNLTSGVLQTPNRLDQASADRLQQAWATRAGGGLINAHKIPVLDSGAAFHSISMPNDQAQFLESRKFQVVEIARWFGLPPHLLGDVERSTSWGTGIEQQTIGLVKFTLASDWLVPTEQRVTMGLLPPQVEAKYNVDALMRGDAAARAQFYTAMRNIGVFSVNEIRDLEDLDPIPDGDSYIQALNMAPLGSEKATGDSTTSDETSSGDTTGGGADAGN
jgi:HK97 family phage portal protein